MKTQKPTMNRQARIAISTALFAIGLVAIYLLLSSALGGLTELVVGVVILVAISMAITRLNRLKHIFGMYLLGGRQGIAFVDQLSKRHPRVWNLMADWGLVMSFGVLSFIFFRKQVSKKILLLGILSILATIFIILPNYQLAFQFINLPQLTAQLSTPQTAQANPFASIISDAVTLLALVGGFASFIIVLIVYYGLTILYGLLMFLHTAVVGVPNYGIVTSQTPGVAILLPGISLPFLSGIVALALLLIVHEFSHGVLARIAKVKLKEIGLIILGSIPLGAYVEPDERQIKKLKEVQQGRILIAGIAANFLLAIITFALLILLINYVLPSFIATKVMVVATSPNSPAANAMLSGVQIIKWNGHQISNLTGLFAVASTTPFSKVNLVTSRGNYNLTTNATAKIGVFLQQTSGPISGSISSGIVYFIYIVLSLSFLLNFFVAAANLLPLPVLDGWQLYKLKIKSKVLLNALLWVVLFGLVLNILPIAYAH
ncbi:MAG: M50 family metallopeptidase [Candidatus Micrarchaeales archaeon]